MLPSLTPMRDEDLAQAAEELAGLGRRAQVGLGHDLEQRHAAAIEIEVGAPIGISKAFVQGLARVLLEMRAGDADPARDPSHLVLDAAAGRNRPLVLGNLVALGQVGIEVVLAREDRDRVDLAA